MYYGGRLERGGNFDLSSLAKAKQLNYKDGWPLINKGITIDLAIRVQDNTELSNYEKFINAIYALVGGRVNTINDCSGGFHPFNFIFELSDAIQNSDDYSSYMNNLINNGDKEKIKELYIKHNNNLTSKANSYIDKVFSYCEIFIISSTNEIIKLKSYGEPLSNISESKIGKNETRFRLEWCHNKITSQNTLNIINEFINDSNYEKLFTVNDGPNGKKNTKYTNWLNEDKKDGYFGFVFPYMFCFTQHPFEKNIKEIHFHSTNETICFYSPWCYNVDTIGLHGKVMPRNMFLEVTTDKGNILSLSNDSPYKAIIGEKIFANSGGYNYITYNTIVVPRKRMVEENCIPNGKSHSCPFIELDTNSGLSTFYMSLNRITSLRGFMAEPKINGNYSFKQIIFSTNIDNVLNDLFSYSDLTYSILGNMFEINEDYDLASSSVKSFKFKDIVYGDYAFALGTILNYEHLSESEEPSVNQIINIAASYLGLEAADIALLKNKINNPNIKILSDKHGLKRFNNLFGKKAANRFNEKKDKILLVPFNNTQVYNFYLSDKVNFVSFLGTISRGMFAGGNWNFLNGDNGYILISNNKEIDIDYLFYCAKVNQYLPNIKIKVNNKLEDIKALNARYSFFKSNVFTTKYLKPLDNTNQSSIYAMCMCNTYPKYIDVELKISDLATDNTLAYATFSNYINVMLKPGENNNYPEAIQYLTAMFAGCCILQVEMNRLINVKDISMMFYNTRYKFLTPIPHIKTLKGIPLNLCELSETEYKDDYFSNKYKNIELRGGSLGSLILSIINYNEIPSVYLYSFFTGPTQKPKETLCFNKSIFTGNRNVKLSKNDSEIIEKINRFNLRVSNQFTLNDVIEP